MVSRVSILVLLAGYVYAQNGDDVSSSCSSALELGFCGDDCDNREGCRQSKCLNEQCERECGKCSVRCNAQSDEDTTTGMCKCNEGWIDPYCLEQCSGACRYPGDLYDDGTPVPVQDTNQLCDTPSRCSCFFGCLGENYDFAGIFYVQGDRKSLPDPGMDFAECACHCADPTKTGEFCDQEMSSCHARCDSTGCRDQEGPAYCYSCIEHSHRNADGECVCDVNWGDGTDESDCQLYSGDCHPRCSGCFGPDADQCNACAVNAAFVAGPASGEYTTFCECTHGYAGIDCSFYVGVCIARCGDCTEPDFCTDNGCINGSVFNAGICECPFGFDGDFCDEYIGDCHVGDCALCSDADHCRKCVDHATLDTFGRCHCEPFWSGINCISYSGSCHPTCAQNAGCSGPTAYDCVSVTANASWNMQGLATCDAGYGASDCSRYIGSCDAKCVSCTGPKAYNCEWCVSNATRDIHGYCGCDAYWSGLTCERYVGPCDSRCGNCDGPNNTDCSECIDHAHMDQYGGCVCNEHWTGEDCTISTDYVGMCAGSCHGGCTGPSAKDCVACVQNASKDIFGACICNLFFEGEDCSVSNEYRGLCNTKCQGCTGPYASNCIACMPHASRDAYGNCVCDPFWTGADCSYSVSNRGTCDDKCMGCTGPTSVDCLQCVPNASRDMYGKCICDPYWGGSDCSDFVGTCHPACNGCTGPTSAHCVECGAHAAWNDFGLCACTSDWAQDDCSEFVGVCSGLCVRSKGCNGPEACDCVQCVPNSHLNFQGFCECDNFWTGESCTVYIGKCDSACNGCYGPSDLHCNQCVAHAHTDLYGRCVCDEDWTGEACDNYVGPCDSRCQGCSGSTNADCDACVENAEEMNGACVCDIYWGGDNCDNYVGPCHTKCDGCFGPSDKSCNECIPHAQFSEEGACECLANWGSTPNCSVYTGPCASTCEGGCKGPTAAECTTCRTNAYRNKYGHCVCKDDWTGDTCDAYTGRCHHMCDLCTGPTRYDCVSAQLNASLALDNYVSCNDNYGGDMCAYYTGVCVGPCERCTGPTAADCYKCNVHAHWSGANCVCDANWTGDDCSVYDETCDHRCDGCSGPSNLNCTECIGNAFRTYTGHCECYPEWGGPGCANWTGMCDSRCTTCHGPLLIDCEDCEGVNTSGGNRAECLCGEDWSGPHCDHYQGSCADACDSCYGVDDKHCVTCRPNAARNADGSCKCLAGYTASTDCSVYNGECHARCSPTSATHPCDGPHARDCDSCIENAHRDVYGECVCDLSYGGFDCQSYKGVCHSTCETCNGPEINQCLTCVMNATLIDGACVCDSDYGSFNCSYYRGVCHSTCGSCTGPASTDCVSCVDNAGRQEDGTCVCNDGWVGDNCSLYKGACDPICAVLGGDDDCIKGPQFCKRCTANAHRGGYECPEDFFCTCDDGWSGADCATYSGTCDPRCLSCHGPYNTHCDECNKLHTVQSGNECVCEDDWGGEDCSIWKGDCDAHCLGCVTIGLDSDAGDASQSNCYECVKNGMRDEFGQCRCHDDWGSDDCSVYQGVCDSHCDDDNGCYGPYPHECTTCRRNAHRDFYGRCVCDNLWSGASCDIYQGHCYGSCASCVGPTDDDCTSCAGMGTLNSSPVGRCNCDVRYNGIDCSAFIGFCHVNCDGCFGPDASHCVRCAEGSYRNEEGDCEVFSGENCIAYCAQCDEAGPIETATCLKCKNGYFLDEFSGTCEKCHDRCKTCDGPDRDNCTACFSGEYNEDSECKECDMTCLDCVGPAADECCSCGPNAMLSDEGKCICNVGLVRHPTTHICDWFCPTGFAPDDCGICVCEETHVLDLSFTSGDFDDMSAHTSFWHPPTKVEDRGAYFDGHQASYRVDDFEIYREFTVGVWARFGNNDSTLISMRDIPIWEGQNRIDELYGTKNTGRWPVSTGESFIELSCSPCNELVFDALGEQAEPLVGSDHDGCWTYFSFCLENDSLVTETIATLFVNGEQKRQVISPHVIFANRNVDFYLGSTFGMIYNFEGFMYNFDYWCDKRHDFSAYVTNEGCLTCDYCHSDDGCLSNCAMNEFIDPENGICTPCHATCHAGCADSLPCNECHPSCRTCNGTSADECTSCFGGAHLTLGIGDGSSPCECDVQYKGEPHECTKICPDIHCEACKQVEGTYMCVECKEGYFIGQDGHCAMCIDLEDCNSFFKAKTESCACKSGQYWDGTCCCRDCSDNCAHCTALGPNHCSACDLGYFFAKDSDTCLDFCASGFIEAGTSKECYCGDTMTSKFQFKLELCESEDLQWQYQGTSDCSPYSANWTIDLWGGAERDKCQKDDPYPTDDRGLWFDGKMEYLTLQGLVLHHTSTVSLWVKPHGYGTLFSSSRRDDPDYAQTQIRFGICENKLEFDDTYRPEAHFYSSLSVEFYYWQHTAFTIKWDQASLSTLATMFIDNTNVGSKHYQGITQDMPDELSLHTIGTLESDGELMNYYRGFIWSFCSYNFDVCDFSITGVKELAMHCYGCDICPYYEGDDTECLGICNWNHFFDGYRCSRCPIWCYDGCLSDGSC